MKPALLLAFLLLLTCTQTSKAQSSCPSNLDFELGDFTNWECFTGSTSVQSGQNVMTLTPSSPIVGRHEIISANSPGGAMDPYGNFPRLCPYGGNYSVKLGNNQSGSQAEGLSYTFTVPANIDTFTFTYFYAVVFQDPDHLVYQQPRFFVTAYEVATGNLINCASFDYVSNGAIPGFQTATTGIDVLYKPWTPASLQFAGLGGRAVRLEFRTADCTLGGHFGYAYIDVGSACSNIMATAPYCVETNSLILNAPYGFSQYTWYNSNFSAVLGNQQSLTLSPPPATSGVFYVDVIPFAGYGCRDTLMAVITPLPVPDTPVAQTLYSYCQGQAATRLTATASPGNDLLWYTTATGGIGTSIAPIPPTTIAGTFYYYVSQKVLFGCESERRKVTVKVVPKPVVNFTINTIRQCQNGNSFIFTSTSTNKLNSYYTWNFGNGQTLSSVTDSVATYSYATSGNFTVTLRVTNDSACSAEKSSPVTVVPKPIAAFGFPASICQNQTTVAFSNTSTVPGNASTINSWWWNVQGNIYTTVTPTSFIPTNGGSIVAKLVVKTAEGCLSDTTTSNMAVHHQPKAAFKWSNPLCNNEIIRFTDLSSLPVSAPGSESITKWLWQFNNNTTYTLQHPADVLTSGMHTIRLIAETNDGCRSLPSDSAFQVKLKPAITLNINDSCVFRAIRYQAADLSNSVVRWRWDMGTGLQEGGTLVSRTYTTEGYRPLTVIGETVFGCKDTILRPFTIYDNKAFAGRDTIAAWNEPVQLNASGGADVIYTWTPSFGLSNAAIERPVALLDKDQVYQLDAVTNKGCDAHSKILIRRYKGPELYIPTAFTPDANGKNDILKVFPVGIKKFSHFAVYNRYGQRLFYTTDFNKGWDGKLNGNLMPAGAYVAYAAATDYKGNLLEKKLAVMLIR